MRVDTRRRTASERKTQPRVPRFVEIIGPAGAGKTTLCQVLAKASECIRLSNFPEVRKLEDAPFFIRHGLRTVSTGLMRRPRYGSRRFTRREFAWLSILDGWPELLQEEWKIDHRVAVLDQGPVYLLTEMREFGPQHLRNEPPDKTWQNLYARWAAVLDAIVWLDAPDTILTQRITGREKQHIMKGKSPEAVLEFLHRYRSAYGCTLSYLTVHNAGFRFLHFDTSRQSPERITKELVAEFGLGA